MPASYAFPAWLTNWQPQLIWRYPPEAGGGRRVFLTFDDGPSPQATNFAIGQLAEFGAKATFFLLGKNARQHPKLVKKLLAEGHAVGNHTHTHPSGWRSPLPDYVREVAECARHVNSRLFRPPYGRIRPRQAAALHQIGYRIVMWTAMSGDYDQSLGLRQCVDNVMENIADGAIIVFHDSPQAFPLMRRALPQVLGKLSGLGYSFEVCT